MRLNRYEIGILVGGFAIVALIFQLSTRFRSWNGTVESFGRTEVKSVIVVAEIRLLKIP